MPGSGQKTNSQPFCGHLFYPPKDGVKRFSPPKKEAREPDHRAGGACNHPLDGRVSAISIRADKGGKPMPFKRFRRAVEPSPGKWKRIEETPIPLSIGRIWLVDKNDSITRAMAFTWPILKRREPRKYRLWMSREPHAPEPAAEAIAALRTLGAT
jgi:hypothetical protein